MTDSFEDLTTGEAAAALGVPLATLKVWLERLPVPMRSDRRGHRRLDARAMTLLEVIKADRARGLSYDTLRRKLAPEPTPGQAVQVDDNEPGQAAAEPVVQVDMVHMLHAIREMITQEGGMANQMAVYAHRAGELQAENKGLIADKSRLAHELMEKALALEAAAKEADVARAEAERLRLEIERLRGENEAIAKNLNSRSAWWPWRRP